MRDVIHVKMTNDIGPDIQLTVHCKSKDDDLGTHVIPFKGDYELEVNCLPSNFHTLFIFSYFVWLRAYNPPPYEFSFGTSIWGGTQFLNKFDWLAVFPYFDIYMQSRDSNECDDCFYRIVLTGPCRFNPEYRAYNICFLWN
ncbi:hypothetical protein DVH24_037078 [Malus domestica]|uniref:S-protein homolog n=1 Tax=Malus domestica TaxID=3750 RepID=A0A498HG43_MALDO|nr:hypothetical protein DVH24_037078 [Malus domestica]